MAGESRKPVFEELYDKVAKGDETRRVLRAIHGGFKLEGLTRWRSGGLRNLVHKLTSGENCAVIISGSQPVRATLFPVHKANDGDDLIAFPL